MTYTIHPLFPNVYHIADPLGVYMTLIVGSEKALLFDTGYGIERLDDTIRGITSLPLIVVNSHGHVDHVLGNRLFAEVYIHPADLAVHRRHTAQEFKRSVTGQRRDHPERFPAGFSAKEYLAKHKTKMHPLADGDVFDLGGVTLTVVHIPGHTPGGIALLDDRDRLLLVGDSASLHVWMFLQESTSMATYIQSLEKLQALDGQYDAVIASHMPGLVSKAIIPRLIHCASHIDPQKSAPYASPIADQGMLYCEGVESLAKSLGLETLDLARAPFDGRILAGVDTNTVEFVSIVFHETKL
jgi:glyoxylase-like metal-dependent hydrolase (beta-lactamase superfamily II)